MSIVRITVICMTRIYCLILSCIINVFISCINAIYLNDNISSTSEIGGLTGVKLMI